MFRKHKHERYVPELNTSSLPDLIFTVLFFFMIVTHMRQTDIKLKVETPQGQNLQKEQKKYAITYIYIGTDKDGKSRIQLNNTIVPLEKLAQAVHRERNHLPQDEQQYHTVSIKADRNTPIGIIADVKDALRAADALQINYSASETTPSESGKQHVK